MEIKNRVKEVREAVGITQAKFAERIAISTSYISELEKGLKEVNERIIRLIAAEYNVSEHWLRTGQGPMFNEAVGVHVAEAIGLLKSLSQPLQLCALGILGELAQLERQINSSQR